jgi:hypothetical protein
MFKKTILATLLLAATTAIASPVNLSYISTNTTRYTQVSVNGSNLNTSIGSYNLKIDGVNTVGFCVDPFQWATSTTKTYDKSSLDAMDFASGNGATRFVNAQKLFDNAYAGLSGSAQTAGFHLALWEIFHGDLNTTTGNIKKTGYSDFGMLAAANTFLGALNGWTATNAYDLTFYGNGQYQDFLVAKPSAVPVPAALPLLASGLIGFVALRRRKTNQA